jgi:hypothetical protein
MTDATFNGFCSRVRKCLGQDATLELDERHDGSIAASPLDFTARVHSPGLPTRSATRQSADDAVGAAIDQVRREIIAASEPARLP